jgi:hypothetical protein
MNLLAMSLTCLVALCGLAIAQVPPASLYEPRGPHAAIPLAICLPNNGGVILHKEANDQGAPPPPFVTPATAGIAPFTAASMFGVFAPLVDIDAIATGNDLIPLNNNWEVVPGPDGWVAALFSVRAGTAAANDGIVWLRMPVSNGAGGDIFGVFVYDSNTDPNTEGVPDELVDRVRLEQGANHLGFTPPPPYPDVVALDPFIPRIAEGLHNNNSNSYLVNNPLITTGTSSYVRVEFYFSLTMASADAVSLAMSGAQPWISGIPAGRRLTGADILLMTWNGVNWSNPSVFRSFEQLEQDAAKDIDALAVDVVGGHTVFSFRGSREVLANRPSFPTGPRTRPVRRSSGVPIDFVNTADVDSICAFDPERAEFHRLHGIPVATQGVAPAIGLSIAAKNDLAGYHVLVSGWKGAPQSGTITLWASIADGPAAPITPALTRPITDHTVSLYFPFAWPTQPINVRVIAAFRPDGTSEDHLSWVVKLRN